MPANKYLSITIPTFNRADYLDDFFEIHVPIFERNNIPVYIADNASTDNTEDVVSKWQAKYPYIFYKKNNENLGMDGNFEVALKLPSSNYIWMLGDTYKLPPSAIDFVLDQVRGEFRYDAFVFNLNSLLNYSSATYTDRDRMLIELVPIMSCVACMVFSKEIIDKSDFDRYRGTYFSPPALIFEYVANKSFQVCWSQNLSITNLTLSHKTKVNWSGTSSWVEIGVEGWVKFIFSLPASYKLDTKFGSLKLFGEVSGLLHYKTLMLRRAERNLTFFIFRKNARELFLCAGPVKLIFALSICMLSPRVFKALYKLRLILKKWRA